MLRPYSSRIRLSATAVARGTFSSYRSISFVKADGPTTKKVIRSRATLPKVDVDSDGKPKPALPPFLSSRATSAPTFPSTQAVSLLAQDDKQALDEKWQRAVDMKLFPDTNLAREIFTNLQAYPDDILLTRVGMFYESYFTQAAEVASLLGIRLTSKVFKDKTENTKKSSKKSTTSSTQTRYPFAGFPVSQREKFFQLLLGLGRSFVVVEEMDKAGSASKDRFVARRYTPGTLLSEGWQTSEETRYLLAVAIGDADNTTDPDHIPIGLAYIDVSTDRTVQTRTSTLGELEHELARISPVEVVLNRDLQAHVEGAENSEVPDPTPFQEALRKSMSLTIPLLQQSGATLAYVDLRSPVDSGLSQQLDDRAEALVRTHLQECLLNEMPKLLPASHRSAESFMQIDASTLLGLEIRQSLRQSVGATAKGLHSSPTSRAGTLLSVIKRTLTPSGTRLLVNSLCQPFTDLQAIARRHDLVESFLDRPRLREDLRDHLKAMSNSNNAEISRIIQRFSSNGNAAPGLAGALSGGRDLWDLKQSVDGIAQVQRQIREALYDDPAEKTAAGQPLRLLIDGMKDLRHWVDRIEAAVLPAALEKSTAASGALTDPETSPTESDADEDAKSQTAGEDSKANLWWINPSYNSTLEGLHEELEVLTQKKNDLQNSLRDKYDLPSLELKGGVYGAAYHIHVQRKAKTDFSLIRADPAIDPMNETGKTVRTFAYNKWAVLGDSIERAHNKINEAQKEAFKILKAQTMSIQDDLLHNATLLDEIDLCLGFAQAADELRFIRPIMNDSNDFEIINGRHPTVEFGLLSGRSARNFTPNSLDLGSRNHLRVITGPNMAGKSTLLRQTAIIAILAQAGSFVPAESAKLGIVDAVFSRVGARDDLYMDRSTFMMEMHETAHILNKATSRSLVIMDEIGRGTTLNSGIAIAYSALDYILTRIKCRTLFATHYHELYDMLTTGNLNDSERKNRQGVEFWCTDVDEMEGGFTYSYRLKRGVNRQSHAIKTAKQAGMPDEFLQLAQTTLTQLENNTFSPADTKKN